MESYKTLDDLIALEMQDPEFAAGWREDVHRLDLAMNVYWLREERGMTQRELADAVGVKQPRIAEIERGDANPTLTTIIRIAQALEVRPERLFADTSKGPPALTSAQAESVARHTDVAGAPDAGTVLPKPSKQGPKPAPAKRSRPARAAKS